MGQISYFEFSFRYCLKIHSAKKNKKKSYIEQDENTINLSQVVELLGNNQNDRWSPSQNVSRMHFLRDFFLLGNYTFSLFSPIYNYDVIVSSLCHVILND